MISQADIIRALVNKNCTDESIMAMALSPDCTVPRLLEKFTEAERFDLALDFSMKLGLDVLPLWKTWAMRCLKNRNFQGAREKFKHCFQRLRSSSGRSSPAYSNLLCDILNELTSMEENKLPLSDEVEIIKHRKKCYQIPNMKHGLLKSDQSDTSENDNIIQKKPKIFSECMQYLRDYGTIFDHIKFYIQNKLWDQAVKLLVDNRARINADKFFIVDVVLYSSTNGHLDDVISSFMKLDPNISLSFKYYKATYNYYAIHRRYNSLYYLQNKIGDHVAAAENQIVNFYLKKPRISYKELDQRLPSLINARDSYTKYIAQISSKIDTIILDECCSILFTHMSIGDAEKRLRTIDKQIEITRNFAINEVQGCINNIEVVYGAADTNDDDKSLKDSPVTLFDSSEKRITFLTALVLIYFDVDCTAYFSESGLNLANQLIQEYKLDRVKVFKTGMRIIIEDESCDIIESAGLLLKRLTEDHITNSVHPKKGPSSLRSGKRLSKNLINRDIIQLVDKNLKLNDMDPRPSAQVVTQNAGNDQQEPSSRVSTLFPRSNNVKSGTVESARILCDDVVRDSIRSCHEPDYKMKLANLLSPEAKIELYVELGKLSIAQKLAFDMNRPDYVAIVLREAEKLGQDHVKDVCQHWLAKH